MSNVIRIDHYRKQWRYWHTTPDRDPWKIWVCANCGSRMWQLCLSGHVRCASCDTDDLGLKVVERVVS